MIHSYKKITSSSFFGTKYWNKVAIFSSFFIVLLVITFMVTRGLTPLAQELSFTEHSSLGKNAGSVIPASCDSVPPWSHFIGDTLAGAGSPCDVCKLSPDAITRANTHFSVPNQRCECDNGAPVATVPNCPAGAIPKVQLAFGQNVQFFSSSSIAFTADSGSVYQDEDLSWPSDALHWNVVGNGITCSASGVIGWTRPNVTPLVGGSYEVGELGSFSSQTKTYLFTCTNGTDSITKSLRIYFRKYPVGNCFTAGTQVTMADGSKRNIETITSGEKVMTSKGPELIVKTIHKKYKGYIYAFNKSNDYFVTANHPFMTTDGWKSFDPKASHLENPTLPVSQLSIGDTLIKEDGSRVELLNLDKKYEETTVYNFQIEGTHDYYANGYWVHNKLAN